MAVSRAMRRLLRVRDLQEEQSKLALESAMGELHRLEDALQATGSQDRRGRLLVEASAHTGELPDRLAGLEESRTAARLRAAVVPRVAAAQSQVTMRREEFLAKRVDRRQAATLIEETEARDNADASRRGQQALDDWHRFRLQPGKIEVGSDRSDREPSAFRNDDGSDSET
ncbi:MAG: hypothetical protein WBQ94_24765 [Terracidiphilus sp.]